MALRPCTLRRAGRVPLLGAAIAAALAAAGPANARVILVGVDGGAWPLIERGMAAGELPGFAALAARGVTADLETVEPVISPVVWTSLATGRSPAAHGVADFFRNRTHVRVPTAFERLAQGGRRVGLYEYLVTWPPRTLPNGFVIPDWLRRDERVTPPDVFARAGVTPYLYEIDRFRTLAGFAENAREEVAAKPERFLKLVERFELDVGAVTFYSVDATSHRFWRAAFPAEFETPPSEEEARHAGVIRETLRGVDGAITRIAASLGPDDTILVVSDHGFEAAGDPSRIWSTRLEERLPALGLEPARDGFEIDGEFLALLLRVVPGPPEKREPTMERLVRLLESARLADGEPALTVDVLEVAERPASARAPWPRRLRALAVRLLLVWMYGVALDRPAYASILARPNDAALASAWPDGRVALGGLELPVSELFQRDEFTGAHHPTAIFFAAGGPIARLAERQRLSVLDVAPLLLYLAGSPVPDDLEGRVPEHLLDPAALAQRPPRVVPAALVPGLPPEPAEPAADDAILMERLRALGYVQ